LTVYSSYPYSVDCKTCQPRRAQSSAVASGYTAIMPKFFCDYCDVYLTHDSMSVRKSHNAGRNHLRNVTDYYQQIGHEKAQSVIDSITNSYAAEGQPNPMLQQPGAGPGFPPMGFPGKMLLVTEKNPTDRYRNASSTVWCSSWPGWYDDAWRQGYAFSSIWSQWRSPKYAKQHAIQSSSTRFSSELPTTVPSWRLQPESAARPTWSAR